MKDADEFSGIVSPSHATPDPAAVTVHMDGVSVRLQSPRDVTSLLRRMLEHFVEVVVPGPGDGVSRSALLQTQRPVMSLPFVAAGKSASVVEFVFESLGSTVNEQRRPAEFRATLYKQDLFKCVASVVAMYRGGGALLCVVSHVAMP